MRPTLYQASRMLTTAGISAHITFDPTKITNRLKKSIQRQVANGVLTGGYQSHSTRIAKYLCREFDIRYTDTTWYGLRVPAQQVEHREQFVEFLQADLAAYLLDNDNPNPKWEKERTANFIEAVRAGFDVDVRCHSSEYRQKLAALIASTRTPEEIKHAQGVSKMLDAGLPITINQYNAQD